MRIKDLDCKRHKGETRQRPPSAGLMPKSQQWDDQERRYRVTEDRRKNNASKDNR